MPPSKVGGMRLNASTPLLATGSVPETREPEDHSDCRNDGQAVAREERGTERHHELGDEQPDSDPGDSPHVQQPLFAVFRQT
jgi:hypothetical protein